MKVKILRNLGLELIHELNAKGFSVPKELSAETEGQEKDVPDNKAAEKLIELGLAEKVEKAPK